MRPLAILVLSPLVLLLSCSSPTEELPPPPPPPLAEATIGPEGGILSAEDFDLTVPEGAFDAATTLTLRLSTEEFPVEDGGTRHFVVEGLPTVFTAPLELTLGIQNAGDGEPLMLVGEEVFVQSLDAMDRAWQPLEATVSEGAMTTTLQPLAPAGRDRADYEFMDLPLGGTFYYSQLSTAHFKIYYPYSMNTHAVQLGAYLEEAYTTFLGLGFDYSARTRWPVRVVVLGMPDNRDGETIGSMWGDNYGSMRFSTSKLSDYTKMRLTAGHEFFHLVQAFYDPRSDYDRAAGPSEHYWVDEAASVWSEERFSDDPFYVSSSRSGLVMEPFKGLQAGIFEGGARFHGYGMSALVKWFMDNESDEFIEKVYGHIRDQESAPRSVELAAGAPFADWYNEFYVDYFKGEIYGAAEIPYMISGALGEWTVQNEDDTLQSFERGTPALGGRIYKVVLNYPQLQGDSVAKFSITGDSPRMLNVFKYNNSDGATLLGSDADSVVVGGIRDLQDQGYWLIALTTNLRDEPPDYSADAVHTLTIQIRPGTPILEALQRSDRLYYGSGLDGGQHYFHYSSPDEDYDFGPENNLPTGAVVRMPDMLFEGNFGPLNFTGLHFSTELTDGGQTYWLEGTLSPDGRMMTQLDCSAEYIEEHDEGAFHLVDSINWGYTLTNLPISDTYSIESDQCFIAYATRDVSALTDFTYTRIMEWVADDQIQQGITTYRYSDWYDPVFGFTFQQVAP